MRRWESDETDAAIGPAAAGPIARRRHPIPLRLQPRVSNGTAPSSHTIGQPLGFTTACARQVTVTTIVCGVDVSSQHLDAQIGRGGARLSVENSAEGIAKLAAFCRKHGAGLLVMEATGGYEKLAFGLLWAEAIPCAIANPRAVRRFAEGMGLFEKTDQIDAGVIAWYAEVKRIHAQAPASATQQQLQAYVTRLRQITDHLVLQKNQSRLIDDKEVLASIAEIVSVLRRQAKSFETKIAGLIQQDPLWKELDKAFRSIKGVADRTVARLAADFSEIGTLSNKAAAKLAGLAPIAKDSGKIKGKRSVRGGRSPVRSILFIVAECVRRHDKDFAAFHQKLSAAGKPKKVIRIALARKLLVRLNAKARDVRKQCALPA
jgi:transposase